MDYGKCKGLVLLISYSILCLCCVRVVLCYVFVGAITQGGAANFMRGGILLTRLHGDWCRCTCDIGGRWCR